MGYNTTMMIMNDGIGAIDRDLPNWWERVKNAIFTQNYDEQQPASNHCNVSQVICCQHADLTQIVTVGGNYGDLLGLVLGWKHHTKDDQLKIVKDLAEQMGYRLVKKPKRIGEDDL